MQIIIEERTVRSVSKLNQEVRDLLEENFSTLWVEGEISNLSQPSSGHLYFSLKDAHAQVRCALFRTRAQKLNFRPKDGMHVIALAQISLYEARGDFQLIIESLEAVGDGALQRAFEALKKRLGEEGLFASSHKKAIPTLPQRIGVVTSATGAAIRDILHVLKRRYPVAEVIIYPTQVQGMEAATQIVKAIQLANQHAVCDVLILARGGGSLEDLWPFNEEIVARAIYHSQIPTVSAIGHEIDFTIADFVADLRAPTPSAAAELVTPDIIEWLVKLRRFQQQLTQMMSTVIRHAALLLENLQKRLPHPKRKLAEQAQRLDTLEQRLLRAFHHIRQDKKLGLEHLMRNLDSVSPLNTLKRGYAIVQKERKVIRDVNEVEVGDNVDVKLSKGELKCLVLG